MVPEFIIKEFDKLINDYGVKTIRITDEMLLNPKYYVPLCEMLKERNTDDDLKMWAYSRIDTVKRKIFLILLGVLALNVCLNRKCEKK